MNTLSERIQARLDELSQARPSEKINAAWLSRKVGVSTTAVSKWLTGATSQLSYENVMKVAAALEVSPSWLASGSGPMTSPIAKEEAATYEVASGASLAPQEAAVGVYESTDELDEEAYFWVDRYDLNLSAGCGNFQWVINKKDPISFRIRWFKQMGIKPENCRALYVRGRSMEPVLKDWDTVVIDIAQTEIVDGEIYAVCYFDEFYIKTIERIPGGVRLKSENPEFQSFDVRGEELDHLRIIGRKVWRGG